MLEEAANIDQVVVQTKEPETPIVNETSRISKSGIALLLVGIVIQRLPGIPNWFISSTNANVNSYIQSLSLADADSITTGWIGNLLSYANPNLSSSITMLHMAM